MAGLHDKILKVLAQAGPKGMHLQALKKRLHPIFPAAITRAARRLVGEGFLEEPETDQFRFKDFPEEEKPAWKKARPKKSSSQEEPRGSRKKPESDPKPTTRAPKIRAQVPEDDTPKASDRRADSSRSRSRGEEEFSAGEIEGTISLHRDGYGFVSPDPGHTENLPGDVFIPPGMTQNAFSSDRVRVALAASDDRNRVKGKVLEVLERNRDSMTGFLEQLGPGKYLLVPTDPNLPHRLEIAKKDLKKAKVGQVVRAKIFAPDKDKGAWRGKVVEVLGKEGDPSLDSQVVLSDHGIPDTWPEAVLKESEQVPTEIDQEEASTRLDLRTQPCLTIDGKDARDLDDAVYLEKLPGNRSRLWVHIADVSHYVRPGSAIDQEAFSRGTSVYLPERVIPMLPVSLSNGICSLNPEVERMALSVALDFNPKGERVGFQIHSTVIRSHHRLTYAEVQAAVVDKDPQARKALGQSLEVVDGLYELAQVLKKRRTKAGGMDFDLPSYKIQVDEEGRPIGITTLGNLEAHGLIEQCMVAANEAVSDWMVEGKKAFVFRNHEFPEAKKLQDLAQMAADFGLSRKRGSWLQAFSVPDPRPGLAEFFEAADKVPQGNFLKIQALRCMKLAEYRADNAGHFGLGSKAYTHFTSPIRRYPDLIVHRLLKDRAKTLVLGKKVRAELVEALPDQTRELSRLERRAEMAERDAHRLKKLHYLGERIGEDFEGVVTGVKGFGIFVELSELGIDGLVPVGELGDEYFHFEEDKGRLIGWESGRSFEVGSSVRVQVTGTSLRERRISLALSRTRGKIPSRVDAHSGPNAGSKSGSRSGSRSKSRSGSRGKPQTKSGSKSGSKTKSGSDFASKSKSNPKKGPDSEKSTKSRRTPRTRRKRKG